MVAACPFPFGRGTPIRIQRQAEALAARGHEVHVATYFLGTAEPVAGVSVHRTPRLPRYRTTSPGPTLPKLLALDPMLVGTLFRLLRARYDRHHPCPPLRGAARRACGQGVHQAAGDLRRAHDARLGAGVLPPGPAAPARPWRSAISWTAACRGSPTTSSA